MFGNQIIKKIDGVSFVSVDIFTLLGDYVHLGNDIIMTTGTNHTYYYYDEICKVLEKHIESFKDMFISRLKHNNVQCINIEKVYLDDPDSLGWRCVMFDISYPSECCDVVEKFLNDDHDVCDDCDEFDDVFMELITEIDQFVFEWIP